VIVGTAAVGRAAVPWRFGAALVVALALQVGVNFANDLFDADRGVDTAARVGPRRAVASGLIAREHMRKAVGAALLVAAAAGTALAAAVGPELFVVGAAAMVAALGYSGGPFPYASAGLGEIFVFVFFGVVATTGSAYVQTETVDGAAVAASVPVGLLASAILVANNARDVEGDRRAGKRTLAVALGAERTRFLFRALVAGAFVAVGGVAAAARSPWPLAAVLAAPAARAPLRLIAARDPAALVACLLATARLELVFGLFLAVGLWAAS
jgi:1,4-dihydroxy-2-naphthoate octaprenyltransferase